MQTSDLCVVGNLRQPQPEPNYRRPEQYRRQNTYESLYICVSRTRERIIVAVSRIAV